MYRRANERRAHVQTGLGFVELGIREFQCEVIVALHCLQKATGWCLSNVRMKAFGNSGMRTPKIIPDSTSDLYGANKSTRGH
jgi:hypothetical protein